MKISSCRYCHHNRNVNVKSPCPVPFKHSSSKKTAILKSRICCDLLTAGQVIKGNKLFSALTIAAGLTAAALLVALCSAGVALAALGILSPAAVLSTPFLLGVTSGVAMAELVYAGSFSVALYGLALLLEKFGEAYNINYKLQHTLQANPGRLKNQKVCLVVEASDKEDAFNSLTFIEQIEERYPLVFCEVSSVSGLTKAVRKTIRVAGGIKKLVVRAHGNQHGMRLERGRYINKASKSAFVRINEFLDPKAQIILQSCETASVADEGEKNIARLISKWCPGHDVIAATESFAGANMRLLTVKPLKMEILVPTGKEGMWKDFLNILSVIAPHFMARRLTKNVCVVYRDGVLLG